MKSLLCAVICCTILLFAFPTELAESESLTDEPVTFDVAIARQVLDLSDSFDEKAAVRNAEADTGIHIEWIELIRDSFTQRVNLMLASGDMPDAFIATLDESQVVNNLSQFAVLNDMIEQYAPNVKAQYDSIEGMWDKVRMADGNIYTLMTGIYTNPENWAGGIPVINKAWLDKLGVAMPTTMDEFYNACVAVRDGDPNGNGQKDEIALEFCENDWCTHIMEYAGFWGFTGYSKVENGKFIATPLTDDFRAFLEYFHKMAKEGLLDVEGFSQTNQQWQTKAKDDRCFMFYTWTANGLFDEAKANEYVVFNPIKAGSADPVVSGEVNAFSGNRFGFAISKTCQNPELMLQWFDRQNVNTETKMIWRFGEEGLLWERDGDKVYMNYPEATEEMSVENMKYTYGNTDMIPALLMPNEIPLPNAEKSPTSAIRTNMVEQIKPFIPDEALPVRSVSAEKISERELIYTDLKAYLDGFVATSIMNGVTDAEWEAHLANAEAYGISQWAQWYQDFIDGKI